MGEITVGMGKIMVGMGEIIGSGQEAAVRGQVLAVMPRRPNSIAATLVKFSGAPLAPVYSAPPGGYHRGPVGGQPRHDRLAYPPGPARH